MCHNLIVRYSWDRAIQKHGETSACQLLCIVWPKAIYIFFFVKISIVHAFLSNTFATCTRIQRLLVCWRLGIVQRVKTDNYFVRTLVLRRWWSCFNYAGDCRWNRIWKYLQLINGRVMSDAGFQPVRLLRIYFGLGWRLEGVLENARILDAL